MARSDDAAKEFKEGLNCAQAILVTYGPEHGLDRETAVRLGSSLGAGVGRTGRICGAANGACLVLGLKYCEGKSLASREKSLQESARFLDDFERRLGAVDCKTLIGCSLRTPAERSTARAMGLFETKCAVCVRTAAEILDAILG
jgi:C_GCAxxG_C_C family probable redox protein